MTAIASALEYAYKGKFSLHWSSYMLLKLRHHLKQPSCPFEVSSFS